MSIVSEYFDACSDLPRGLGCMSDFRFDAAAETRKELLDFSHSVSSRSEWHTSWVSHVNNFSRDVCKIAVCCYWKAEAVASELKHALQIWQVVWIEQHISGRRFLDNSGCEKRARTSLISLDTGSGVLFLC